MAVGQALQSGASKRNPTTGVTGGTQSGLEGSHQIETKTNWTKFELEQLWNLAGGKKDQSEMAAAIALAESAGKAKAENHNENGSIDRGLWQINSVHGAQSTFSPLHNAMAAVAISNRGTDWSAWSTYKNGAYKAFLGPNIHNKGEGEECVELAGQKICGPAGEALSKGHKAVTGAISWTEDLAKVLSFLGSGAGWARVGKVVLGGALAIIALSELSKAGSQSSGPGVASRAVKATPAGGAVGFVKGE